MQTQGVYPECVGQAQGKKEKPGDHVPSLSGSSTTHTSENEELVIASMKLTSLHSW